MVFVSKKFPMGPKFETIPKYLIPRDSCPMISDSIATITNFTLSAATVPPLLSSDHDQLQYDGTPPTPLSLLLASTSTEMEGMVGQLLEMDGNGTLVYKADPVSLIDTLRPHCGQHHVADFAKLLAESLAKKPVRECEWTRLVLTCVFCIVALFGFVGNLLTVLVIFRTPSLHSHTNYFLASLAASDLLLISVGVSFDLVSLWRQHLQIGWISFGGFCEATSTAISWFTFCSILTIVGLTGERLVAICYPFNLRPYFYHGSMIWLTCVLWIISFFPSLYIGLQFKRVVKDFCGRSHPNMLGNCDFVGWGGDLSGDDHYTFEAQLLITFVFPVIFIIYCYIKILRALNEATSNSHHLHASCQQRSVSQQSAQPPYQMMAMIVAKGRTLGDSNPPSPDDHLNNSPSPGIGERHFFGAGGDCSLKSKRSLLAAPPSPQSQQSQQLARHSFARSSTRSHQAHKTVMKMLVTITILFFICYLPYHLERLIVKYTREYCDQSRACVLLYPITGLLQYVSATLNPIIYNVMSRRFRREFLRLCHRMCGREVPMKTQPTVTMGGHGYRNHNHGRTPMHMTPLNRLL